MLFMEKTFFAENIAKHCLKQHKWNSLTHIYLQAHSTLITFASKTEF